ncbi:MAG: hypothetical protein JW384_02253 [Nitrosomonadaceae bacterium]|nr:hypothetical protein [Nitrosomonadaceae bacterium]
MDNIDEFLASLSPEETEYLQSKIMEMSEGADMTAEMEEPNASDSDEYTNGKGPNNEAKGGDSNATVPKALAKSVVKKKDSIPLKEAEMFDEEE